MNNKKSAASPPIKKRRWLRWLVRATLLLLILAILSVAFLPLYSGAFVDMATGPIAKTIGREVSVAGLSVSLLTSNIVLENLSIKEEDGSTEFIHLKKVAIDFSIWPSIFGSIEVPKIEITGLNAQIEADSDGRFNFQSILDQLNSAKAERPEEVTGEQSEKPLSQTEAVAAALPHIEAAIAISDINLSFVDRRQDASLQLQSFGLECQVQGLDNIQYRSQDAKISYKRGGKAPVSCSLVPECKGTISLKLQNGQPVLKSSGSFVLAQIYTQGLGKRDLQNHSMSFNHDVTMDMVQGTIALEQTEFVSDYLTFAAINLEINQLQQLQKLIEALPAHLDIPQLQTLCRKLPLAGWRGNLELALSLDQIKEDFGILIAELSKGQLQDFGGNLDCSFTFDGSASPALALSQNMTLEDFYIAGRHTHPREARPYRLALKNVEQKFTSAIDFHNLDVATSLDVSVTTAKDADTIELMRIEHKASGKNLLEAKNSQIEQCDLAISANLDAISATLQDFLPENTTIHGNISHRDNFSGSIVNGFSGNGDTEIIAHVKSPKTQEILPLHIVGKRDFQIRLDSHHQLQKIDIANLSLEHPGISAIVSGNITDIETKPLDCQFNELKARISGDLSKLTPILKSVLPDDCKITNSSGTFVHSTTISGGLNAMEIINDLHYDGNLSLAIHGKDPQTQDDVVRELLLDEQLRSGSKISITGINDFLKTPDGDAEITATILPSYLQILLGKNSVARVNISGKAIHKGKHTTIDDLRVRGKIYGKTLHKALPVEFIAAADQELEQLLKHNLEMNGYIDINLDVYGSTERDMKVNLRTDLTPFAIIAKHGSLAIKKLPAVPMLSTVDMMCNLAELQKIIASTDRPMQEERLGTLGEKERRMLQQCNVVAKFLADDVAIDDSNSLQKVKLDVTCNDKSPDNLLDLRLSGRVNSGNFDATCKLELNQPHPVLQFAYNIEELPYIAGITRPIATSIEKRIPFPILQKMEFKDLGKATFTLRGAIRGQGVDWRAVKKNLVSTRDIVFQLPQGQFDLGYDISRLVDMEALQQQVQQQLEPLRQNLSRLQQQQQLLNNQSQGTKREIQAIDDTIQSLEQKREQLLTLIKSLENVPFVGNRLEQAKKTLAGHNSELENYKHQKQKLLASLEPITQKLNDLQRQAKEIEEKIAAKQSELSQKTKFANPFQFDFANCTINIRIENKNPWDGVGDIEALADHTVSQVHYLGLAFSPPKKDFPQITGWSDFDGAYRFHFGISDETMEKLRSQMPPLAELLKQSRGIVWNNQGFEPSPFNR